ncbi:2,5-didehydrogluconate reductase DkgB [Shewanella surugensis]|uniref:2,5-didehydrogluconate reductase DkgB n=1 Tax=Shewanella surugensis TaxID=212020 RepID=A0ABT0LA29_9GAMM|nr:2,5-didehydrogluconate reductase DkgB [Shewanella surugensis]MCL1124564.1 2,5-didehydrogluconate reductase DkgB [Shewanella surugensis]
MTHIPAIGMGTYRLTDQVAFDSVSMALKVGYRHIDTAAVYQNEIPVGQAISKSGIPRDDIFLTTKVWINNLSVTHFIDSVKISLDNLDTDYVDLLLIHWPSPNDDIPMFEYLAQLANARAMGLTQYIGVSNFTINQMKTAMDLLPRDHILTNQIEIHPYLQNKKLIDFCQSRHILVTAYMPFAVGKALADDTIKHIAKLHKATPAQIILAWMDTKNLISIPSSSKQANLESNLHYTQINLTTHECKLIDALDKNERIANPDFAPKWDE